jgi:thymidylate synthase ThyX
MSVQSQILVKIIEDSIVPDFTGRLTTFQLQYPRLIHQEFLTYRVFSRNSASSRAIPIHKLIEQVRNNPAIPAEFGKNCPGMQSKELLDQENTEKVLALWKDLANYSSNIAQKMSELNVHKQVANRVLEPFMFMHTIVTSTEWNNFFNQRCHEAADPTIRELAIKMRDLYNTSQPKSITPTDWHLPYVTDEERKTHDSNICALISAARCARVSYINHDGTSCDFNKDLKLANRLLKDKHLSPFEHQAKCSKYGLFGNSNFGRNWTQQRSLVELNND